MPIRTTPLLVGKIVRVRPTDDLDPFIEAASSLVDSECTASGYDAVKLERIERWLAAHFYVVYAPRRAAEGIAGGPQQTIENIKVDLGLWNTKYGQQAMMLDTAGNLAALANEMMDVKKALGGGASTKWLGTPLE